MEDNLITNMDIQKYLTEGFYVGNTNEIIKDQEEFKKHIKYIIKNGEDVTTRFKKGYQYRYQYPQADVENKPHSLNSFESIKEREEHIKTNGFKTIQRWWEKGGGGDFEEQTKFFRNILDSYLPTIYPELKDNIKHNDAFTIYEDGDFIERHVDGRSPERYCVVLIYLSEKKDYIDGCGGRLIVGNDENNLEYVIPISENFVMMDFTKHDIIHEVEKVSNGFKRYTYLSFVYNEELFYKEELKQGRITESDLKSFNKRAFEKIFGVENNVI